MNKKKENVSTVMLLPIIKINKKLINNFHKFGFRNTYLFADQLKDIYKFNLIYILFEPDTFDNDFNEFIIELSENSNYIETIDIGYKRVLVTFKIPDQFKGDFKLFLEGAYSKVSDAYKKCFSLERPVKNERGDIVRTFTGATEFEPTAFFHIFNKTQKLRDIYRDKLGLDYDIPEEMELYDKYKREEESLVNLILV